MSVYQSMRNQVNRSLGRLKRREGGRKGGGRETGRHRHTERDRDSQTEIERSRQTHREW